MSTPNSSERTHPIIPPNPRVFHPSIDPINVENEEVPTADEGNITLPSTFEVGGSSVVTVVNDEFGNEFPFYTVWPYILNERRRVAKENSATENRLVAMGWLASY